MKIEILYAVNINDNTKTNLLAAHEGENPDLESAWEIVKKKLYYDDSDEELYNKLGDIIEGFTDEYDIYKFGWDTNIPLIG